jgi:hypothetical protein
LKTTHGTQEETTEQEIDASSKEVATVHTEQEISSISEGNKLQDQVAMFNQNAGETNAKLHTFTEFDLLMNI